MVQAIFRRPAMAALTSLALLGGLFLPASVMAADKPAAVVNGNAITSVQLGLVDEQIGDRLGQASPEEKKSALTDVLVDMYLMSDAAQSEGMDKSDDFKARLDLMRRQILRNEFYRVHVDEAIKDADLKALYDSKVGAVPAPVEVKARHILLKTEDEAKAVIKELNAGGDFIELAKTKSTGPSAKDGGDLGYFTKGQMVPAFEAAVFKLEKGTFTKEPVKSDFGWHVILLEDKREKAKPTFDQVKDQLRPFVAQDRYMKLMEDLKAKAKIELPQKK